MTTFSTFTLLILLGIELAQAQLPKWENDDLEKIKNGNLVAGKALLDSGIAFESAGLGTTIPDPIVDPDPPTPPDIIRPIPVQPEKHDTPPVVDGRINLSKEWADRYFSAPIDEGITDPQQLLSAKERLDVQYALERYAEESPVSIYFYLFDKNQKIPEQFSPEATFNNYYYSQPSAVIVYYFIEEPERCKVHFGGKDANAIATNKIRSMVRGIRISAQKHSNRINQLDALIRQLSLHMFWIEKAMIDDIYLPFDPTADPSSNKESKTSKMKQQVYLGLNYFAKHWWLVAIGAGTLVLLLLLGVRWVTTRKFTFPELAIADRLDLPKGGTAGGLLSYDNRDAPPSAQRKQFDQPF